MKEVEFLGDSLKVISGFPKDARQNAGRQLAKCKTGAFRTITSRCRMLAKALRKFGFEMNRELSRDVHGAPGGCGLRFARVSEEDDADFEAGQGNRQAAIQAANAR